MKCEFCNGTTVPKIVNKYHRLNKKLYYIENVPADVCQNCHEKYFQARILDRIDEMIQKRISFKEEKKIEVFLFDSDEVQAAEIEPVM